MMYYKKIYQYVCCLCAFFLLAACGGGSSEENLSSTGASSVTQGVAVDPYVVGAVFQEVAADGSTVLQRQSTPSDEFGVFTFPNPLTVGSTIEMKISNKIMHGGVPFQGMLRRSVNGDDRLSVVVTPLTTLLANGIPAEDVLQALSSCGFTELTAAKLYADPMQGLTSLTGGIVDRDLRTLQAAMAVEAFMEITGNFEVTVNDLYDSGQLEILKSTAGAMRQMLNAAAFTDIKTALENDTEVTVQPILGEFIMTVLQQQQGLVVLAREDLALNGFVGSTLVSQTVQAAMGEAVAKVKEQCLARQTQPAPPTDPTTPPIDPTTPPTDPTTPPTDPTSPPDGPALYNSKCADCHKPLNSTNKPARTAAQIQTAIDINDGGMGGLNTLTAAEVQAIADALPAAPPTDPTTPPDGVALYNSECFDCHLELNSTNKPGRSAAQIQTAIDNDVGGMGDLNILTVAEVQAIADALPAAPPTDPTTPPDGVALYNNGCSNCHLSLNNTNKPGQTAAQIQTAIDNDVGGMGGLNNLTVAEVQAIADVLPAAPPTVPGPDYSNCMACHGQPSSGRHTKHLSKGYSCTVCHNTAIVQTAHSTNPATTDPAATIGGGTTSVGLYQSGSCSNLSSGCHNSKSW